METSPDLSAHLAMLRALCSPYPRAEEYVMVHHPAFRVGKKPFAILGHEREGTLMVKVPREEQHLYLEDPRFFKTPYIGQHGWVSLRLPEMAEGELRRLVDISYRGAAPKRAIAELDSRA